MINEISNLYPDIVNYPTFSGKTPDTQGTPPAMVAGMPVGGGVTPQPAFVYRGVWIPLVLKVPQGHIKSVL